MPFLQSLPACSGSREMKKLVLILPLIFLSSCANSAGDNIDSVLSAISNHPSQRQIEAQNRQANMRVRDAMKAKLQAEREARGQSAPDAQDAIGSRATASADRVTKKLLADPRFMTSLNKGSDMSNVIDMECQKEMNSPIYSLCCQLV